MGNKNEYLTLEDSARTLGRPKSFLKTLMSEGKLGAKLAGGHWWISVQDLEELRQNLPSEHEKFVHNFLTDTPPRKPTQKPKRVKNPSTHVVDAGTQVFKDKDEDLQQLDARVRNLAAQVAVRLAYVHGGRAVWNKIRVDNYKLQKNRRAALPNEIVALLGNLQKTKQRYILLREVERYKRLLRSVSEWDFWRVVEVKEVSQTKRSKSPTQKPKPALGVEGYSGRDLSKKRYWFAEE